MTCDFGNKIIELLKLKSVTFHIFTPSTSKKVTIVMLIQCQQKVSEPF